MRKYLMEAIGAFFLVTAVCFTGNPLAIGLTLAIMIYCGGHISGGHYNPAVSLAVFMRKGLSPKDLASYWVFQLLGGIIAGWLYSHITGKTFAAAPAADAAFASAMILEAVGTFALALVVLSVATSSKLKGNYVYGFAIGLTLTSMIFIGGAISGGAFNPAVGMGPALYQSLTGGGAPANALLYIVGPCIGAALAALAFGYLNEE